MTGRVLVVGREERVVAAVVPVIGRHGVEAVGTTVDAEALAALDGGDVRLLVIGGGIGARSRDSLERRARAHGVDVVDTPLRDRDVGEYVDREIVPRLRVAGGGREFGGSTTMPDRPD